LLANLLGNTAPFVGMMMMMMMLLMMMMMMLRMMLLLMLMSHYPSGALLCPYLSSDSSGLVALT
jgi:hypothetical protein